MLAAARRWGTASPRLRAFAEALEGILGASIEVRLRRVHAARTARPFGPGIAWCIENADAAGGGAVALVQAETALGAAMLGRVLRRARDPLAIEDASPSPSLSGAAATIFMAAARRAHAAAPVRIVGAGSTEALRGEPFDSNGDWLVADFTVMVADDAYSARVLFSRRLVPPPLAPAWNVDALRALGDVRLGLPVVACTLAVARQDFVSLRSGDALLVPGWRLSRESSTWRGPVALAAPGATPMVSAELTGGERLVLRDKVETPPAADAAMEDSGDSDALLDVLAEAPVLIRVEIGEATMTAREWASLARGDVIALGRRVGERVLLRVGAAAVARAELVEIEGEIAVRLVERVDAAVRE